MPQLQFEYNMAFPGDQVMSVSNGTLSFFPFVVRDSISWSIFNILVTYAANSSRTQSFSVGLYSLNGSTLSLANSVSGTAGFATTAARCFWASLSATSATQNITPGTWFFGVLVSTSNYSNLSFLGGSRNPANAFPGSFIGGGMTASTNALPATYATSDLDITGSDALSTPSIIITA